MGLPPVVVVVVVMVQVGKFVAVTIWFLVEFGVAITVGKVHPIVIDDVDVRADALRERGGGGVIVNLVDFCRSTEVKDESGDGGVD